jgi:hypothetical protein
VEERRKMKREGKKKDQPPFNPVLRPPLTVLNYGAKYILLLFHIMHKNTNTFEVL